MVDFVDLATSSSWLVQRVLGQVVAYDDEDDFANLEVNNPISSASPYDNMNMANNGGTSGGNAGMGGADSYTMVETRPFLSKSAEAELYLLATNFLLCKKEIVILFLFFFFSDSFSFYIVIVAYLFFPLFLSPLDLNMDPTLAFGLPHPHLSVSL